MVSKVLVAASNVTKVDAQVMDLLVEGKRQKDVREELGITTSQICNSIARVTEAYFLPEDVRTWKAVAKDISENVANVQQALAKVETLQEELVSKNIHRFNW